MYYLDFIMLIQVVIYSVRNNIALNVFGESIFLSIQDFIIICLIWHYQGVSRIEFALAVIFLVGYPYLLSTAYLDASKWELVIDSSTLLIIGSRFS